MSKKKRIVLSHFKNSIVVDDMATMTVYDESFSQSHKGGRPITSKGGNATLMTPSNNRIPIEYFSGSKVIEVTTRTPPPLYVVPLPTRNICKTHIKKSFVY